MFIYNLKLDSKNIIKIGFIVMASIITIFFIISIYKILSQSFKVKDEAKKPDVAYIKPDEYTSILQSVYDDLDSYVGQKICFSGYVYRNSDFEENNFVLARDMQTSNENQTLVVGFLCSYKDAKTYENGTWIEITAKIEKGHYHGEIPILEIIEISKTEEPEDSIVCPPKDAYVPTAVIF